MTKKIFLSLILLAILGACTTEKEEITPEPTQKAQEVTNLTPFLGQWQGIIYELGGVDQIPGDTIIDMFLNQPTPSDIATYATIMKGPNNYERLTAFEYGVLEFSLNMETMPNQLVIKYLGQSDRIYLAYDIIRIEADTLELSNPDRKEFWCRY